MSNECSRSHAAGTVLSFAALFIFIYSVCILLVDWYFCGDCQLVYGIVVTVAVCNILSTLCS